MSARWTISGEEGKSFGPNQVAMGNLAADGEATLTRTSASEDTLKWTSVVSFEVELIDTAYSSLTTIYRSQDFDYLTAPSDLASNLLAAQSGIPYFGSISLGPDHLGEGFAGRPLNVHGALGKWANMRTLVQSETIDLKTGITDLSLGLSERVGFAHLLGRLKTSNKDNVVQNI